MPERNYGKKVDFCDMCMDYFFYDTSDAIDCQRAE